MYYVDCELKHFRTVEGRARAGSKKLIREASVSIPLHSEELSKELFFVLANELKAMVDAMNANQNPSDDAGQAGTKPAA